MPSDFAQPREPMQREQRGGMQRGRMQRREQAVTSERLGEEAQIRSAYAAHTC